MESPALLERLVCDGLPASAKNILGLGLCLDHAIVGPDRGDPLHPDFCELLDQPLHRVRFENRNLRGHPPEWEGIGAPGAGFLDSKGLAAPSNPGKYAGTTTVEDLDLLAIGKAQDFSDVVGLLFAELSPPMGGEGFTKDASVSNHEVQYLGVLVAYAYLWVNAVVCGATAPSFSIEGYLQDPWIQQQVGFWVDVYSRYSSDDAVLHDAEDVRRIYEVLDLSRNRKRSRFFRILAARKKWRALLESVQKKVEGSTDPLRPPFGLSAEELRVFHLFSDSTDPSRFAEALRKKRMRVQFGQKDRFLGAIRDSRKYIQMMEQVFRDEGVPVELTRIPFVESGFNSRALSKVGAAGIWQLMPSTGRQYLEIGPESDQRKDPTYATRAAARLLKDNFKETGSWPLAIVAYNHGRKGMLRAVRQVGSDDVRAIIQSFRSRSFGFASRNFFMEFLAAYLVERDHPKYFGTEVSALGGH